MTGPWVPLPDTDRSPGSSPAYECWCGRAKPCAAHTAVLPRPAAMEPADDKLVEVKS